MKQTILYSAIAMTLASGSAMAASTNNQATVGQSGVGGNSATIDQSNNSVQNTATITQVGTGAGGNLVSAKAGTASSTASIQAESFG